MNLPYFQNTQIENGELVRYVIDCNIDFFLIRNNDIVGSFKNYEDAANYYVKEFEQKKK